MLFPPTKTLPIARDSCTTFLRGDYAHEFLGNKFIK